MIAYIYFFKLYPKYELFINRKELNMKSQKIWQMYDTLQFGLSCFSDLAVWRNPICKLHRSGDIQKIDGEPVKFYPQGVNLFHLMLVVILLLFGSQVATYGQTPSQSTRGRSYFGAPVVKYTAIRDQGALMFGGRGGWNITPSTALGFGLYGTVSEVDGPEGNVPNVPGVFDLKFESFGFDLEYATHPEAPTHLTLNAFLGGGAVHNVKNNTSEQEGETDFMLLLESAVGVEREITDWLHLNFAVSYRLVNGVEQPRLNDSDLNGPAVSFAVKFGRF
jgi:hypothetical protein